VNDADLLERILADALARLDDPGLCHLISRRPAGAAEETTMGLCWEKRT
jgi:hypothetical protein